MDRHAYVAALAITSQLEGRRLEPEKLVPPANPPSDPTPAKVSEADFARILASHDAFACSVATKRDAATRDNSTVAAVVDQLLAELGA